MAPTAKRAKVTASKGRTPTMQVRRFLPVMRGLDTDMVSTATLNGGKVDARLSGAITALEVALTIDGANLLSMGVHDPDRELLRSDLVTGQIDLDLGSAGRWRMDRSRDVGGIGSQGDTTTLKLWDLTAAALRAQTVPVRKSSAKMDVAGWTRFLAHEIRKDVTVRTIVPYPGQTPPQDTTTVTSTKTTPGKTTRTGSGFSASSAAKVKVKGTRATSGQLKAIDAILAEATRLGAARRVRIACIMCATQESDITNNRTGDARRSDTVGYFQQGPEWIGPKNSGNPTFAVRAFLLGSRAAKVGGTGSTKGWRQRFGSLKSAPSDLGAAIFKVQIGGAGANAWKAEATRTVDLWSGATTSRGAATSASSSRTVKRPAEWRRGTGKTKESSWTALDREAKRLGRRRFVALPMEKTPRLVVATDQQLIRAQPHLTLRGLDDTLLTEAPSIELDGVARLQTIDLAVVLAGWSAPPGGVVDVVDAGPADGPWIVGQMTVQAGSDTAAVTLQQPTTKVEAAPATSTAAKGSKGSSGRSGPEWEVYREAVRITKRNLRYAWGGGHGSAGHASNGGFDCSGYVVACLAAAHLGFKPGGGTATSGVLEHWGRPGRGKRFTVWANSGHTFIQFNGMDVHYGWADTSYNSHKPPRTPGPRVRRGSRSTSGFVARHWQGL